MKPHLQTGRKKEGFQILRVSGRDEPENMHKARRENLRSRASATSKGLGRVSGVINSLIKLSVYKTGDGNIYQGKMEALMTKMELSFKG